ncbi:hypothetical protein [Cyclobacterium roseum]|uniref:hypothetical protein n=1 Tax=Cyclobacterium roseum TaxID=2666137 RepID=UPI0013911816|nr:hypothetical protein [Cyclobacterium roseum]
MKSTLTEEIQRKMIIYRPKFFENVLGTGHVTFKNQISIHKRRLFSDIQMILTFVGSIGLLAACPGPEQKEKAAVSYENLHLPNEDFSFDELD